MADEGLPFGRYRLLGRLGRGGMGEIWLAESRGVGDFRKQVVLKRVAPELARRPEFRERFLAEGELAVSLSHPNIVQVFELGEEGDEPFLTMEHVDGWDLADVLAALAHDGSRMPLPLALRVLTALAEALGYAHRRGVVHRDVSPGNVMLDRHGAVKLVDFGVAALAGAAGSGLKEDWAPPEQLAGDPASTGSDVFSLGVVAWTLIAGTHPYRAGAAGETSRRRASPELWSGMLPTGWESALRAMTALQPAHRTSDGDAAARIFRELAVSTGPLSGPEELGAWVESQMPRARVPDADFDTLLIGGLARKGGPALPERTLTRAPSGASSSGGVSLATKEQFEPPPDDQTPRRPWRWITLGLAGATFLALVWCNSGAAPTAAQSSGVPAVALSAFPFVGASWLQTLPREAAAPGPASPEPPATAPHRPSTVEPGPEVGRALPADTPAPPSGPRRGLASTIPRRIAPLATVRLRILPATARLLVDGRPTHRSDGVVELRLSPGSHQLTLEAPSGARLEREVHLSPGEVVNLRTLEVGP